MTLKHLSAAISILCISAIAHGQAPAGWKVVKEDTAKCEMAVPADWKQQEILGKKLSGATAADKSSDAIVNLMDDVDWSLFKSIVWQVYTGEKDKPKIQDTATRLWFEIGKMAAPGMTSWYVAVPGKAGTCNAQVNFRKGDKKAEEAARKIVETIRGA